MTKSIEQLRFLNKNPFYQLTEEELKRLQEADGVKKTPKKKRQVAKGATAKETGKVGKHSTSLKSLE